MDFQGASYDIGVPIENLGSFPELNQFTQEIIEEPLNSGFETITEIQDFPVSNDIPISTEYIDAPINEGFSGEIIGDAITENEDHFVSMDTAAVKFDVPDDYYEETYGLGVHNQPKLGQDILKPSLSAGMMPSNFLSSSINSSLNVQIPPTSSSVGVNSLNKNSINFLQSSVNSLQKPAVFQQNFMQNPMNSSPFQVQGQVLNIDINDPRIHSGFWNFSNFVVIQPISEGGFGVVFKAKNKLDPGRSFAIKKIYKNQLTKNGSNLDYVRREIQTQLNIVHPNIVRVFSWFNSPDDVFVVMEHCGGGNLYEKINIEGRLSEEQAFRYFIQIIDAIQFLHYNNIAHRDIKPENILFDEKGQVKLCDFGWAMMIGSGQRRQTFCGTYEYMSPEMVKDRGYDKCVDIWALGILLYEMVHGYSPFRVLPSDFVMPGKEHRTIFNKILHNNYFIDSKLGLSPQCVALIRGLLQPDPNMRMKIDDVYNHPWIKMHESQASFIMNYKEDMSNVSSMFSSMERSTVHTDLKNEEFKNMLMLLL